jgi:hypothetical protein
MKRLSLFMLVVAAACGGDDGPSDTSGFDQTQILTSFSTSERTDYCAWAIEVQGGPGHVTQCGDGVTVTAPTQSECEADLAALPQTTECTSLTVGDYESCIHHLDTDPCGAIQSDDCAKWLACVFSGM